MKQYRQFNDSSIAWRVYRVEPESMFDSIERLRHSMKHDVERRQPWLLFESSTGERRRLTPVPERWDENCTDAELAAWCAAADPIPPAPMRRQSDHRAGSGEDPTGGG